MSWTDGALGLVLLVVWSLAMLGLGHTLRPDRPLGLGVLQSGVGVLWITAASATLGAAALWTSRLEVQEGPFVVVTVALVAYSTVLFELGRRH